MSMNLVTAARGTISTLLTRIALFVQNKPDLKESSESTDMLAGSRSIVSRPKFGAIIFFRIPYLNLSKITCEGEEGHVRETLTTLLRTVDVLPEYQYVIDHLLDTAKGDFQGVSHYDNIVDIFIGEDLGRYINDDTRDSPRKLHDAIFRDGD